MVKGRIIKEGNMKEKWKLFREGKDWEEIDNAGTASIKRILKI